jgi:hypothetical protein
MRALGDDWWGSMAMQGQQLQWWCTHRVNACACLSVVRHTVAFQWFGLFIWLWKFNRPALTQLVKLSFNDMAFRLTEPAAPAVIVWTLQTSYLGYKTGE